MTPKRTRRNFIVNAHQMDAPMVSTQTNKQGQERIVVGALSFSMLLCFYKER